MNRKIVFILGIAVCILVAALNIYQAKISDKWIYIFKNYEKVDRILIDSPNGKRTIEEKEQLAYLKENLRPRGGVASKKIKKAMKVKMEQETKVRFYMGEKELLCENFYKMNIKKIKDTSFNLSQCFINWENNWYACKVGRDYELITVTDKNIIGEIWGVEHDRQN